MRLIALAFALGMAGSASAEEAQIGKPAPDFTLKDESGKEVKLSSFKGKNVVLEWTNPGCPYVLGHYERGTMKNLAEKYRGKDVVWLAVDSTNQATADKSKEWVKKWGLGYPELQDADGKVGKLYGATNTPHMMVVDKDGVLRYRGAIDDDASDSKKVKTNYIDTSITALLAGKAPDPAETKAYGCGVKYKM